MKRFFVLAVFVVALIFGLWFASTSRPVQAQGSGPLVFTSISGSTATCLGGTITVNGVPTAYPAGSVTGFTASMGDCSLADIANGSALCNFIYMPAAGGALQTSNSYAVAYPYILGLITPLLQINFWIQFKRVNNRINNPLKR